MTRKVNESDDDPQWIDQWPGGFGWFAHPDEGIQRASHALVEDGEAWIVEPVDAEGIDDHLEELGDVVGVVVLLDRHSRDAGTVATRYGVPVYVPAWMPGMATAIDAPVRRFDGRLGETSYQLRRVLDVRFWREGALVSDDGETLIVPETVGTAPYYRVGTERLGVHPLVRLVPPKRPFRALSPERLLVGHGMGVMGQAGRALSDAMASARRRAPRAYATILRSALPV